MTIDEKALREATKELLPAFRGIAKTVIEQYDAAKEPVSLRDCAVAAYGYCSPRAKVKLERVRAILRVVGVPFKEDV